jgi:hypothetical protein
MKTRTLGVLIVAVSLSIAGCKYESPLTNEHTIPIDLSVLGIWQAVPDKGEEVDESHQMIVLQYSETEYLVHISPAKDGIYFRGYRIKIGDISCVQLQEIGTDDGPIANSEKSRFDVATYQIIDNELEVKTLNTDLVSESLTNPEALKAAFTMNLDNQNLFVHPVKYMRVKSR